MLAEFKRSPAELLECLVSIPMLAKRYHESRAAAQTHALAHEVDAKVNIFMDAEHVPLALELLKR